MTVTEVIKYLTSIITIVAIGSEFIYLLYVSHKLHKDNIHTNVYEDKIIITILAIAAMFFVKAGLILLSPNRLLIHLINVFIVIAFSWLMTVCGMQLLDKRKKIKNES